MYFFCLMAADRLRAERTGDTIAGNSETREYGTGMERFPRETGREFPGEQAARMARGKETA